jgi:heme/copper-type cytochrome/quinol oxidase subunit 2
MSPGQPIEFWFEATQSGQYGSRANCKGLGHYRMRGQVTVEVN